MKKSDPPIFLQIHRLSSFLPKTRAQIDQKTLPRSRIWHQTTTTKIVSHPTDHGNAHFGPTQ
jgi:hypothetical protein